MFKAISLPLIPCVLLGLGLTAAPAQAQLARTFVSAAHGDNNNNCDRPTPCRTFQTAAAKTIGNGEIAVLDPGDYGSVAITKAISIVNDGVGEAGMQLSGDVTGITVNAGPNDSVSLRGLTIKGVGSGHRNGILFVSGMSLRVENCVIRNLPFNFNGTSSGIGIWFTPNGPSQLSVSNTLVADSQQGIVIAPTGAISVQATLNRIQLHNDDVGLSVGPSSAVTVSDSIVDGSSQNGIAVSAPAGAITSLTVVRSVIANSDVALAADGANAKFLIGQSTLAGNVSNWQTTNGGILQSTGDNAVTGSQSPLPLIPTQTTAVNVGTP